MLGMKLEKVEMRFRAAFLFLLMVLAGCELVHGHIFLDPLGSMEWGGDCSEANCTLANPCSVPAGSMMTNNVSGHGCDIILIGDNWVETQMRWESTTNEPVTIYFRSPGVYSLIQFEFIAPNMTVKPFSAINGEEPADFGTPFQLTTGSVLKFTASAPNSVLHVDGVEINSQSKIVLGQAAALFTFDKVTFRNAKYSASSSVTPIQIFEFFYINGIQELTFDHCFFNATGPNVPLNLIHWNGGSTTVFLLAIRDSELYGKDLFHPSITINLQSFSWTQSTFGLTGGLLQIQQPVSWIITDCEVLGMVDSYPPILTGSTAGSILVVDGTKFQQVLLPATGTFRLTYSVIIDVRLETEAIVVWEHVSVDLSNMTSKITIHGAAASPARTIEMVNCTVNSGPGNRAMFVLDRFLSFAPTSDLRISWISLGATEYTTDITFSNLTVTGGIQGLSALSTEIRALPNATWTWSSLGISDTVVSDLSNLRTFNYIASYPNNGINKHTLHKPVEYYPFHLSNTSNISVNVVWDPIIEQNPSFSTVYPIIQLGDYSSPGGIVPIPSSRPNDTDEPRFRVEITTLGMMVAHLTYFPPVPIAPTCPMPYPPGFQCVNGVLFAPGNVQGETISLPPNIGVVFVNGSLQSSKTLVFEGLGTTLNVSGCVVLGSDGILIDLSKTSPSKGSTELESTEGKEFLLITQAENCNPISAAIVEVNSPKGCKQFNAKNGPTSTHARLTVVFHLDSSKCNTKWIILGSVLGGAVVIAVIALVLLVTFNRQAREFFRPHSRKRRTYS